MRFRSFLPHDCALVRWVLVRRVLVLVLVMEPVMVMLLVRLLTAPGKARQK